MTSPNGVDDRELEELLAGRAARAARGDDHALLAAVRTRVRATHQDRLVPLIPVRWERMAWLASVAVALVIGLGAGLVGPRWLAAIGSTASPSITASGSPSSSSPGSLPSPTSSPTIVPTQAHSIPLLPEQLAAAATESEGQLVVVRGRMDPVRLPCPVGPAGCWAGRLAGYDGDPIFGAPDVDPNWSGGGGGSFVLRIQDGKPWYVGQLYERDGSIGPFRASTLPVTTDDDPLVTPTFVLAEGALGPCRDVGDCALNPVLTDVADPGAGVLLQRGAPITEERSGLLVLRGADPRCFTAGTPDDPCPTVSPWTFLGWVAGDTMRAGPVPTCDRVEGDVCSSLGAFVARQLLLERSPRDDLRAVHVGPVEPPSGSSEHPFVVLATRVSGTTRAWGCDAERTGDDEVEVRCDQVPSGDLRAAASLEFVLEGTDERQVIIYDGQGTSWEFTLRGTETRQLAPDHYFLMVVEELPGRVAGDLCSKALPIEGGERLRIVTRVRDGVCDLQVLPNG
jgi:hypothetical protein